MEEETLTGSGSSSSSSSSSSEGSNSSADTDNDNHSDNEEQQQDREKIVARLTSPSALAKLYNQRYNILMERINAINQDSEHLVSRILQVQKLCRTGLRHRAAIIRRLDIHRDNFRNIPVTLSFERDTVTQTSMLSSNAPHGDPDLALEEIRKKHIAKSRRYRKRRKQEAAAVPSDLTPNLPSGPFEPDLPKRPHNAFFYYTQNKRPQMQKEFPNLSKKDITTILSSRWSQISDEEKLPFLRFEDEKRKEYQAAVQIYKEQMQMLPSNQS